jgi:C-terminal processing protease CtpA/Prc
LWTSYYLPQGFIDSITVNELLKLPNGIVVRTDTVFTDDEEIIKLNAISNRFYGSVYVLTSNFTFSSATDFAWCFKHYNMGKVVGEETGGWGLCYGDNVYAELPNSRLPINVSCKLFYNIGATETSTHGVIPDFQVKSEDALEYVIKIIEKSE